MKVPWIQEILTEEPNINTKELKKDVESLRTQLAVTVNNYAALQEDLVCREREEFLRREAFEEEIAILRSKLKSESEARSDLEIDIGILKSKVDQSRNDLCSLHRESLQCYCANCSMAVCTKCITSSTHQNHTLKDIDDLHAQWTQLIYRESDEATTLLYDVKMLVDNDFQSIFAKAQKSLTDSIIEQTTYLRSKAIIKLGQKIQRQRALLEHAAEENLKILSMSKFDIVDGSNAWLSDVRRHRRHMIKLRDDANKYTE